MWVWGMGVSVCFGVGMGTGVSGGGGVRGWRRRGQNCVVEEPKEVGDRVTHL